MLGKVELSAKSQAASRICIGVRRRQNGSKRERTANKSVVNHPTSRTRGGAVVAWPPHVRRASPPLLAVLLPIAPRLTSPGAARRLRLPLALTA